MRALLLAVVASALPLTAQEPDPSAALSASRQRLERALQKAAAWTDTAFEARWGPDKKPKNQGRGFAQLMAQSSTGAASGSWHEGLLHLKYDGDKEDELVLAGRRMLARSTDEEWTLRAGRFADGNDVPYVPDVELLLQRLADWKLALTHRVVSSLDDRPAEILSVTLNADQVAQVVWAGLVPPALTSGMAGGMVRVAFGGAGGRRAQPRPDATIDLAITIDPATSVIHRLQFRAHASEGRAGNFVIVGRAGAGGGDEEKGDEEPEEEIDENAPLVYVDGLPKRSRKKKTVTDFTVRFSKQGQEKAPELDERARKLLGL